MGSWSQRERTIFVGCPPLESIGTLCFGVRKRLNRSRCCLGAHSCGPKNHLLDGDKFGRIHSPPRGVARRWCGFFVKFFDHFLLFLAHLHKAEAKQTNNIVQLLRPMLVVLIVCRCGSGWTWSRTHSSCSTWTSRAPWTRACQLLLRLWWTAAPSANRSSARTRPPASCSTPGTFPSIGNGSKGTTDFATNRRIILNKQESNLSNT